MGCAFQFKQGNPEAVAMSDGEDGNSAAISHLYRFRSIKNLIDRGELENQEIYLVLRFRNNGSMASCCIIDFVMPGVDDWLAIDVANEGHQALFEFVFGGDAKVAQY
jgi:hypothetical protein